MTEQRRDPTNPAHARTALLLPGGGARAAYQVGVLQAISLLQRRHADDRHTIPFDIIVGTSAGAINAVALACSADRFHAAVTVLARLWSKLHSDQVYRVEVSTALRAGLRWLGLIATSWWTAGKGLQPPRSLLDNAPLRALLQAHIPVDRLPQLLATGHLRGLGITASSYRTGEHVLFYNAIDEIHHWQRTHRRADRTSIGIEHIMASSAIPFVFPATRIDTGGQISYYGDGSMRQLTPLAPAIHMGAERVLAIGVSCTHEPEGAASETPSDHPSLAHVASQVLSSIFLDTMENDAHRLHRINDTLALLTDRQREKTGLRPINLLTLSPSCNTASLAAPHVGSLPASVRALLGTLGTQRGLSGVGASDLATYLLFEGGFTCELMQLGRQDTMARRGEICRFFGWRDPGQSS